MSAHDIRLRWRELLEDHPRLDASASFLRRWLPPLNFITLHYAFFIFSSLFWSLIFWASSEPRDSVSYVDSLYMVTSALTNTGLNSVNLSSLTAWQQVLLWLLFIVGSAITVSFVTIMIRKHAFERRFENVVRAEREMMQKRRSSLSRPGIPLRNILSFTKPKTEPVNPASSPMPGLGAKMKAEGESGDGPSRRYSLPTPRRVLSAPMASRVSSQREDSDLTRIGEYPPDDSVSPTDTQPHITFADDPRSQQGNSPSIYAPNQDQFGAGDPGRLEQVGFSPLHTRAVPADTASIQSHDSDDFLYHFKKILGSANTHRSGQFFNLSHQERERLGGCEYRALRLLSVIVPLYAFLWMFLGAMALGGWISRNFNDPAQTNGANPWWTGIFLAVSSFNNAGMSLIDANMVPFATKYFVLIVVLVLVMAGNTAYPLLLRLILWSALKILELATPPGVHGPWKETIDFILQYPRRVYTTLFPSRATWWLFSVLVAINLIDRLAFEVLNIGNPQVDQLSMGTRIIGGLCQAISVRAAGFVIISVPSLYPGTQFLYVIMMYIAAYPVVITLRNSNIYEERSLGIYSNDPPPKDDSAQLSENNTSSSQDHQVRNGDDRSSPPPTALRRRRASVVIGQTLKRTVSLHGVGVRRPPKPGADEHGSSRVSFVAQQIRGQLAHDLWWLTLAIFAITIIETDHFRRDPITWSLFNIIFEVVSAYGNVGLSTGLPDRAYSFSGAWHKGSKVVLCLVMLRGRHRGLPVALDAAVRLPGEMLHRLEEEDWNIRRSKTIASGMSREFSRSG